MWGVKQKKGGRYGGIAVKPYQETWHGHSCETDVTLPASSCIQIQLFLTCFTPLQLFWGDHFANWQRPWWWTKSTREDGA